MNGVSETLTGFWNKIKKEWKTAFTVTFLLGLLIHLPVFLGDFPNHDGLDSMYFDQNMITSGRWFLTIACGLSSYFSLPWLTGLLSLMYLGIAAAALCEFLHVRDTLRILLISGLLVSFPALCATYGYLFTADGYMMALMLVMLALTVTDGFKKGFLAGGILLSFSLGIYQSYLAFAAILALTGIMRILFADPEEGYGSTGKDKLRNCLKYAAMGGIGLIFYYLMLRILLLVQGKVLASYQGINGAENTGISLMGRLKALYHDFAAFTVKGRVLGNGMLSYGLWILLLFAAGILFFRKRLIKKPLRILWLFLYALLIPLCVNWILLVSPQVNYHLLMRYQWVLFPILLLWAATQENRKTEKGAENRKSGTPDGILQWCLFVSVAGLIFHYAVTDQIAYANLEKKYEKTYAYCLRLVDRMEQTPGYTRDMPVAMIGVQSRETFPLTDVTGAVTDPMIGMNGDYLLYTGRNYQAFCKHYLGVTFELVPEEAMEEIYYSDEYQAMDSFPGPESVKVVNGILYIKTE